MAPQDEQLRNQEGATKAQPNEKGLDLEKAPRKQEEAHPKDVARPSLFAKGRRKATLRALKHGAIGFLIGAAATIAVCFTVFDIGRNYNPDSAAQPSYDLMVLQERLANCNELATATYIYTDAEAFEDGKAVFGLFDIPFLTGKDFILTYEGIIKAGVNLDDALIEQGGDDSILVTLPKPYIISHEIDESSVKVLREHETVFSSIKIDDIQNFRETQKESMEQRAQEVGLMDTAAQNAQDSIRSMLEMAIPEGTPIEFLQQE